MKIYLACLVVGLIPAFALADTSADAVAPPTCKKPLAPSALRKADDTSEYDEKVQEYQDCIKAYVDDQQTISQKHIDAANGAIANLNAYIKEVNERRQSQ